MASKYNIALSLPSNKKEFVGQGGHYLCFQSGLLKVIPDSKLIHLQYFGISLV
jgi:hypothetical protein